MRRTVAHRMRRQSPKAQFGAMGTLRKDAAQEACRRTAARAGAVGAAEVLLLAGPSSMEHRFAPP